MELRCAGGKHPIVSEDAARTESQGLYDVGLGFLSVTEIYLAHPIIPCAWERLRSSSKARLAFAEEFAAESNRLQVEAEANLIRIRSERERVCRQIDRLVDALADGEPAARLKEKLKELERRRLELEHELETTDAPAPRLHPNIAEAYRHKVEELHATLRSDDAGTARELIRGLVEAIVLWPEDGRLRVEVRGELAAILRLSGCANEKAPAGRPELLVEQIKMVAGA